MVSKTVLFYCCGFLSPLSYTFARKPFILFYNCLLPGKSCCSSHVLQWFTLLHKTLLSSESLFFLSKCPQCPVPSCVSLVNSRGLPVPPQRPRGVCSHRPGAGCLACCPAPLPEAGFRAVLWRKALCGGNSQISSCTYTCGLSAAPPAPYGHVVFVCSLTAQLRKGPDSGGAHRMLRVQSAGPASRVLL